MKDGLSVESNPFKERHLRKIEELSKQINNLWDTVKSMVDDTEKTNFEQVVNLCSDVDGKKLSASERGGHREEEGSTFSLYKKQYAVSVGCYPNKMNSYLINKGVIHTHPFSQNVFSAGDTAISIRGKANFMCVASTSPSETKVNYDLLCDVFDDEEIESRDPRILDLIKLAEANYAIENEIWDLYKQTQTTEVSKKLHSLFNELEKEKKRFTAEAKDARLLIKRTREIRPR